MLDDLELEAERRAMTDAHTELLAERIREKVLGPRPWALVNRRGRLRAALTSRRIALR